MSGNSHQRAVAKTRVARIEKDVLQAISQILGAAPIAGKEIPWYEAGRFWGGCTTAIAIVLTVIAAMQKDVRSLLLAALPFAALSWSVVCKPLKPSTWHWRSFLWALLTILTGVGLWTLYVTLPHSPKAHSSTAQTPIPTGPSAPFEIAGQHLNSDPDRLTLHDLFLIDFPSAEVEDDSGFTMRDTKTHVEWGVVRNIEEGSELIKLYIPYATDTDTICADFIRPDFIPNYDYVLKDADRWVVANRDQISSRTLTFSRRIFIYHEYALSPEQVGKLDAAYRSKDLILILRDVNYLDKRQVDAKLKIAQKNS